MSRDTKRNKKIIISVLIITAIIVGAGMLSVIGSTTELVSNSLGRGYDVYNTPIEVARYQTDKPILQVYSATVEHEFDGVTGTGSRYSVQFMSEDGIVLGGRSSIYIYTNSPIIDVTLSPTAMTDAFKGKSDIIVYAKLSTIYSSDNPATTYMDMELNDLTINYNPVECVDSDTIDYNAQVCDDGDINTDDICYDYKCQHIPITTVEPSFMDKITSILYNFIRWVTGLFYI